MDGRTSVAEGRSRMWSSGVERTGGAAKPSVMMRGEGEVTESLKTLSETCATQGVKERRMSGWEQGVGNVGSGSKKVHGDDGGAES